jgi:hypothetical protein
VKIQFLSWNEFLRWHYEQGGINTACLLVTRRRLAQLGLETISRLHATSTVTCTMYLAPIRDPTQTYEVRNSYTSGSGMTEAPNEPPAQAGRELTPAAIAGEIENAVRLGETPHYYFYSYSYYNSHSELLLLLKLTCRSSVVAILPLFSARSCSMVLLSCSHCCQFPNGRSRAVLRRRCELDSPIIVQLWLSRWLVAVKAEPWPHKKPLTR